MRKYILALLAIPAFAQISTMGGMNGLGHSSMQCLDRTGNGHGIGPTAVTNTTLASNASAGATSITVSSATGISAGIKLRVDLLNNMEGVLVSGSYTSGTTIPLSTPLLIAHSSGASVLDQGCAGVTVDQWDASVTSASQIITKYGSVANWMAKRGRDLQLDNPIPGDTASAAAIANSYANPHATWYLAPSGSGGSDSNACNTISVPCLTETRLLAVGYTSGDTVFLRQGWSGSYTPPNGTSSLYSIVKSYPGEHAITTSNWNFIANTGSPVQYIIVDGVTVTGGAEISGGTNTGATGGQLFNHILFEDVEVSGGSGISGLNAFNGIGNATIQDSIFHGNDCSGGGCQHGVYWGCRDIACSNVMYRRSIAYGNDYNGFTFNGRCTSCTFTQLLSYSNGISGLTLEMGVSSSTISSVLLASNANSGLTIFNYPGDCPSQGGSDSICPYDQTGNTIENVTIYQTGNANVANAGSSPGSCPGGISYCGQSGIVINNTTSPLTGNLGGNTFRNIIVTSYGYVNHYQPIIYEDNQGGTGACGSTCLNWLSTSTFQNVDGFQTDGNNGTGIFGFGPGSGFGFQSYTCSTVASFTTISGCTNGDPLFLNEGISLWNGSETTWDFRLSTSSPAYKSGYTGALPYTYYDLSGRAFYDDTPSMGALERNLLSHQGWNALTSCVVSGGHGGGTTGEGCGYTTNVAPLNGAPLDTLSAAITSNTQTSLTFTGGAPNAQVGNLILVGDGTHNELMCISAVSVHSITTGNVSSCNTSTGSSTSNGRGWGGTTAQSSFATGNTTIYYNVFNTGGVQAVDPSGVYPAQSQYVPANGGGAGRDGIARDILGKPKMMCFWGGGHSDYSLNEITCVSPNRVTPTIGLLTQPSTFSIPGFDTRGSYLYASGGGGFITNQYLAQLTDGTPDPTHIPAGIAYMPWLDRMCKFGGAYATTNGQHGYDIFCYDFGTSAWLRFNGFGASSAISTTGTASSGSTSLTVASATGIRNGMAILGTGIAPTTTVSAGQGTTSLTLTVATTAPLSSTALTFAAYDVDCGNYGAGTGVCDNTLALGNPTDPFDYLNGNTFSVGPAIADQITQSIWHIWSFSTSNNGFLDQYYPTQHQDIIRNKNIPYTQCCVTPGNEGNGRTFIPDKRWILTNALTNSGTSETAFIVDISGATSQTPTSSPNPSSTTITLDSTCSAWYNTATPGLVWDSAISQVIAYPQGTGGNTYYLMQPPGTTGGSWVCTSASPTSGPPTVTSNQMLGGYMQYFASMDATFIMDDTGANVPRILSLNPPDPTGVLVCTISPSTLPNGTVGVAYGTQTLTALNCGGSTLTWTVSVGSLPAGITGCSGTTGTTCSLSGTPTTASTYNFTIQVTDGGSNTATQPFTVVISGGGTTNAGSTINGIGVTGTRIIHIPQM